MKNYINVPSDIQYLSDWTDFNKVLPTGKYIFNKVKTGCGASTYFLTNQYPTIVCVPRKMLIKNKLDQLDNVFSYIDLDSDEYNIQVNNDNLDSYLEHTSCPKILVTYDSFFHILDRLRNTSQLREFIIVVDEWTSIFDDSTFKADKIFSFLTNVLGTNNDVIFMSATPPDDTKIEQVPEFKNLLVYELCWDDTVFVKPFINYVEISDINYSVSRIIQDYRDGNTPSKLIKGNIVQSKEAVFFLNNVSVLTSIIERNKILPEEVNILCAHNRKNWNKLRKISKKFKTKYEYGNIPKKGDPHKMFTFCTKTVFLGCDFYSTSAYTYIISNPNREETALDISSEFYQIIGRQRLAENVFKDEATLLYTATIFKNQAELDELQKEKDRRTHSIIDGFNYMPKQSQIDNYMKETIRKGDNDVSELYDYSFMVRDSNTNEVLIKYNHLIPVQEQAVFDNMNRIYNNEFSVARKLLEEGLLDYRDEIISDVFPVFRESNYFKNLLRFYSEYRDKYPERGEALEAATFIPIKYHKYYNELGSAKLKALEYIEKYILNEYNIVDTSDNIESMIHSEFFVSSRYTNKDIKCKLQGIYDSLGLLKKAKAGDLNEYFFTKIVNMVTADGKRDKGLELIKKK